MLLSKIDSLFHQSLVVEDFKKEIAREIADYKKELAREATSIKIVVNEDIENLSITKEDVKILCDAFLNQEFDKWELNYLAEGLLLSEKISFDKEEVKDALSALADPEYFSLINPEYVQGIMKELYA